METTLSLPVFVFTNMQFAIFLLFKALADSALFFLLFMIFLRKKKQKDVQDV